jgi:hypothetical protein
MEIFAKIYFSVTTFKIFIQQVDELFFCLFVNRCMLNNLYATSSYLLNFLVIIVLFDSSSLAM